MPSPELPSAGGSPPAPPVSSSQGHPAPSEILPAPAGAPPRASAPGHEPQVDPAPPAAAPEPTPGAPRSYDPSELEPAWTELQAAIRERVQTEQFETWFRRTALVHVDDGAVRIAVQNGFTRDWLNTYYRDVLEQAVTRVFGGPRRVEFTVDPELMVARRSANEEALTPDPTRPDFATQAPEPGGPKHVLLEASDTQLNAGYQFETFVVGPCNRFAHAASVGVSETPGQAYNPFFVHGRVGLGKTHLLQSLCHSILDRTASSKILYLSCETFVNHFISALENGDLQKFRTKYRNVDVLVVDDIHLLANKERTQEEFFHTFNTLYNAGKQIVLSSDSPPKDIPTLQGRLVSRFKWGLVTEIEPPCFETRVAILKRKSRHRGHELPDDVAAMLAEHIDTNIRELEGAVVKLLGYAQLSARAITVDLARECLRDVFTHQRGAPTMEDILRLVTEHFGVKLSDLLSRKRTNAIAWPRQVGMYLARRVTRHSLEEIGGYFGGRDHSTVLYAIQKLERKQAEDSEICELLASLLAQIGHRGA